MYGERPCHLNGVLARPRHLALDPRSWAWDGLDRGGHRGRRSRSRVTARWAAAEHRALRSIPTVSSSATGSHQFDARASRQPQISPGCSRPPRDCAGLGAERRVQPSAASGRGTAVGRGGVGSIWMPREGSHDARSHDAPCSWPALLKARRTRCRLTWRSRMMIRLGKKP